MTNHKVDSVKPGGKQKTPIQQSTLKKQIVFNRFADWDIKFAKP